MLDIAALLLSLTALFSYLNHRFLKLPTTIGVMVIALSVSAVLALLGEIGFPALERRIERLIGRIDFYELLMEGLLSLLLFAGALHIDLAALARRKWPIGVLATFGVVASTFLVGGIAWALFDLLGLAIPLVYCLLFGALISPTDPIAVLAILKSANAPESLEVKIAGESLFNDGVAVVIFTILLGIAAGGAEPTAAAIAWLFVEEAIGGALFGFAIGYVAYRLLASIERYDVEVLITLALVLGGYAAAQHLHVSGPIAMVVAGLLIGNHGRAFAMSETTRRRLDSFWEIVDEILNAVLFVLIGFEMVILTFGGERLAAAALLIPAVLAVRFACVGLPVAVMRRAFGLEFTPHAVKILTWGGIRGGISVALALSLPAGPERETLVAVTYVVVLFSILAQGLTIGRLVRASVRAAPEEA